MTNNGRNRSNKSRKNRNDRRKKISKYLRILEVVIYKAFCLDVEQGHMKGAPNERILEVVI